MREKIEETVKEILFSPATNGQEEESIKKGVELVESLIISACEEQKRICEQNFVIEMASQKEPDFQKLLNAILNSPLPSGIDSEDGWIDVNIEQPDKNEKVIAIGQSGYDGVKDEVEIGFLSKDYTGSVFVLSNLGEGLWDVKLWKKLKLPNPPKDK